MHRNRRTNNFVSVLSLRNLDVFGLLVDFLLGDKYLFSGGSVSVFLMTQGFSTSVFVHGVRKQLSADLPTFLDDVFVHGVRQQLSVDLRFANRLRYHV